MMGGHGRESSVLASVPLSVSQVYHVLWGEVLVAQFGWNNQLARLAPSPPYYKTPSQRIILYESYLYNVIRPAWPAQVAPIAPTL